MRATMNPISDYVDVHLSLIDVIQSKRSQYRELDLTFKYERDASRDFAFVRGNYSDFSRSLSNLFNNAVEAMECGSGVITGGFTIKGDKVEIRIRDEGKGMPEEVVARITSGVCVGTTKQGGRGIGLRQVFGTIEAMNGSMFVESKENVGTEFKLTFPRSEIPFWFADKIAFCKGAIIVALDDDPTICVVWEERFREFLGEIKLKCFTQGFEAIDFLNSLNEKEKETAVFLTDYDLRGQGINGLNVIERCGMESRSIIVTSAYLTGIKGFEEKRYYLKMLSKTYVEEIELVLE